ncbi:MAG: hypothetical protein KDD82_18470, partial [Planctomycetes bacterium]|nr:hypothetical protein [Planctomycetota bacterium]
GAFRYLTQDDPDAWRPSSTLLPAPAGRAFAVSRPDVRVGFKSAVGVWQPGDEAPRFVGLGSATWLGDWLVVSDAYAQGTLEVFELSTEALRRYDVDLVGVSAAPSAKQAVARALWVLDQDRQDLQGLLVDRVEDELWAVPAPIFKTVRGRGYAMDLLPCREWFDGGYCVKNLTRGTRWLPPPGTVVAALVGGWALLRDATGGCRAVNVVSGAEFLPERDLPPAQRTPWLQLVRVQERPMLLGLVHDEDDRLILWARDLNAPSSAQVAELPCEGLRSGDLPRVNVWPTAGPYLLIDPHPHRGPYEVSTWALDGVSLPVVRKQLAGAYGLCGPRAGDYLVVDPATRCLARCSGEEQGPPLEGLHEGVLSRARIAWLATGELLVAHRDGRVSRVNEGGALEPMLELGAPETWPGARKLSAR